MVSEAGMVVEDRGVQHLLGAVAALGLGVVAPCVLPGALMVGAAGAVGGIAGEVLANALQKQLDKREKDPTLPDINHDLLRVIADGVAHGIAEFGRQNGEALGDRRRGVEKLARGAAMAYTALFVTGRLPEVTVPDALALLEAAARDGGVPKAGNVAEWEKVVRRLSGQAGVGLDAEVETWLARWLHERVWESIKNALKSDFAHDGRGYAALHLSFMGDLMSRVDALSRYPKEQQEAMQLTRELIEALKAQNQRGARPKGEAIIQKLTEGDRTRLGRLTQRFEQLSASIDRHFEELLSEVREADRGSRRRDAVTHERLAWTLCGIAVVGMLVTGTFLILRDKQIEHGETADGIARGTQEIGRNVGQVGERIGQMDEKVDRLVSNLLVKASGDDQQVEALRTQLESMVRSLAAAEAAGDAEAKKGLAELEGGNLKVVSEWLDQQIAQRRQAVNYLLNQRSVMDLLQISRGVAPAQAESDLEAMARRLEAVLDSSPDDFDANNLMGVVHMFRNEPAAARKRFNLLLVLAGSDQKKKATGLRNLATLEANSGNLEEAVKLFQDELGVQRRLGDAQREAESLTDIGLLEMKLHLHRRAESNFAKALEIYHELKMPLRESGSLTDLGKAKLSLKEDEAAEKLFLQAYDIEVTSGTLDYQASLLSRLGSVNFDQNDLDTAESYYGRALEVNRKLGDKSRQATDLEHLAEVARERGDLDKASLLYRDALAIYRELDSIEDANFANYMLAGVELERNNLDGAETHSLEALKSSQKLNRLDLQGDALTMLIEIQKKRGNGAAAAQLETQRDAVDLKLSQFDQADAAAKQGFTAERNGDLAQAIQFWGQARDLFVRIDMRKQADQMQDWINWGSDRLRSAR